MTTLEHPFQNLMLKEPSEPIKILNPKDIFPFCQDLIGLPQEAFFSICLDVKSKIIERRLISLGILDASLIHPRELFRYAILRNALQIICIHNHPSGDPTPSQEDIRITRQLIEAGRIMGIPLMDHIIIGNSPENKISLRENGVCLFN